jgi:fructokinase
MPTPVFGAMEAGGTKFVCAVGSGPDDLHAECRFPTTTPDETVGRAISFFREQHAREPLAAIGAAAFGPVDLHADSSHFGYITTTPKAGWQQTDIAGRLHRSLGIPVAFDNDVNAAALGEHRWGAGQGLDSVVYFTIGTGIGAGVIAGGRLIHGLVHPEIGHIPVPRDPMRDAYAGCCPFHGDCLEGLACGPAIAARWGAAADELPPGHPAWKIEAGYLAWAVTSCVYMFSPQRVILGGGVMQQEHLFPLIRSLVKKQLNGYVQSPAILDRIDEFIVPPALGNRSGVLGAVALAQDWAAKNG